MQARNAAIERFPIYGGLFVTGLDQLELDVANVRKAQIDCNALALLRGGFRYAPPGTVCV